MAKRYEMTQMDVDLAPSLMRKGSNSELIAHLIGTRQIAAKANVDDPSTLYACLEEYLKLCIEQNIKVTNMAAYAACGVSSQDVSNWERGLTRASDKRYKEFAQFIRSICSQYREQAMVEGIVSPVVGIWHQKNYDGMRDDPIVADITETGLETKQDPEEIAAKYRGLLEVSDAEEKGE